MLGGFEEGSDKFQWCLPVLKDVKTWTMDNGLFEDTSKNYQLRYTSDIQTL